MAWDEVEESLPAELKFIYEEVRAGRRKLDLKSVMEGIPRYQGLPVRPPENNHRGDAKNGRDRTCRDWQSKLLHLKRAVVSVYVGMSKEGALQQKTATILQQIFQMPCELN